MYVEHPDGGKPLVDTQYGYQGPEHARADYDTRDFPVVPATQDSQPSRGLLYYLRYWQVFFSSCRREKRRVRSTTTTNG